MEGKFELFQLGLTTSLGNLPSLLEVRKLCLSGSATRKETHIYYVYK